MFRCLRTLALLSFLIVFSCSLLVGQEDAGWRISPENINIQMGADRTLQILDDSAQELRGAMWSVDDPDIADLQEVEEGRVVVHAKKVGMLRVRATIGGETRLREIKVWSALRPVPIGTSNYALHPIGREIGDLPAVPTPDGPNVFSLEQTVDERTYLRADREDGIQVWIWLLPEKVHDVELICGDWLGGAMISANREDSYTLYAVGKDGNLRWQRTIHGTRKGFAVSTEHLVHLLNQSMDGTETTVVGIDEENGAKWFELSLPASREKQINVRKVGANLTCEAGAISSPTRTDVSRIMVNMDGLAYVAFVQRDWTLQGTRCSPGSPVDAKDITLTRDDKLLLWQIHPGGSYNAIVVETFSTKQPLSDPIRLASPTGALVTDNMNGTLVPVRVSEHLALSSTNVSVNEFVYRVNQDGELLYRFPLPKYTGHLADEMVIGEDNVAFATRGPLLVAFNLVSGKELWRWESAESEISVFAALANGNCLVQTPTVLMEVANSTSAKSIFKGKAMMDWQGQMYRKHN